MKIQSVYNIDIQTSITAIRKQWSAVKKKITKMFYRYNSIENLIESAFNRVSQNRFNYIIFLAHNLIRSHIN